MNTVTVRRALSTELVSLRLASCAYFLPRESKAFKRLKRPFRGSLTHFKQTHIPHNLYTAELTLIEASFLSEALA